MGEGSGEGSVCVSVCVVGGLCVCVCVWRTGAPEVGEVRVEGHHPQVLPPPPPKSVPRVPLQYLISHFSTQHCATSVPRNVPLQYSAMSPFTGFSIPCPTLVPRNVRNRCPTRGRRAEEERRKRTRGGRGEGGTWKRRKREASRSITDIYAHRCSLSHDHGLVGSRVSVLGPRV
eukprot:1483686-Rhodomonas_salina.2